MVGAFEMQSPAAPTMRAPSVADDVVSGRGSCSRTARLSHTMVPPRWEIPANLVAAAGAVGIARARGASWGELGLDPEDVPAGLRLGLATLPPIGVGVALALANSATRQFFTDERVSGSSNRELAYHALVRIPLATAIAEELLFRSALYGATMHAHGRRHAQLRRAPIAFGLWHIVPAVRSHDANPAGAALARRIGGRTAAVTTTVVATAAAGVGFAWLRSRSRSVVASIVAHAGVNIAGLAAASWVARRQRSSPGG